MHQLEAEPEDGGKSHFAVLVARRMRSQPLPVETTRCRYIYSVTETGAIRQDDLEGISVAVADMGGKTRIVREPHHLFPEHIPVAESLKSGLCRGTTLF